MQTPPRDVRRDYGLPSTSSSDRTSFYIDPNTDWRSPLYGAAGGVIAGRLFGSSAYEAGAYAGEQFGASINNLPVMAFKALAEGIVRGRAFMRGTKSQVSSVRPVKKIKFEEGVSSGNINMSFRSRRIIMRGRRRGCKKYKRRKR